MAMMPLCQQCSDQGFLFCQSFQNVKKCHGGIEKPQYLRPFRSRLIGKSFSADSVLSGFSHCFE